MNDKVSSEYELNFSTNADKAAHQVKGLNETLDEMGRSGELSSKGLNQASRGILSIEKALGGSTGAVKRYSDSFSQLRKEAAQAEQALQRATQASVSRGRTNPLSYAANSLSIDDARRFDAINRASNLSLQQAAQERIRLEDRLTAAKARSAEEDRKLVNLGRDRKVVAEENLAAAQRELQAATGQKASLGAGGGRHGGGAATIGDQVAAEERLAAAKKGVTDAQRRLNAVNDTGLQTSAALRYANYDLATTYGVVAASIAGLGALTATTFADLESGFSKVERTTGLYGASLDPVRDQLLELSRVLPVTTQEIQDLAARGAQMGIAADEVAGFADVMAKFIATSPEVDVNSVAEAFGRLSNLTGTDDFEALASSIAQVGVNSAATDAQIIKTTQEMARATNATSLTASEVIGLAAAFSSLGIAPEAARGIMNQFFTQLDKGAAGMNESLAVAGQIMGMTEKQATDLFNTDAGAFFQQFVSGLSGVENITVALGEMGLSGQRLLPAFKALAEDSSRNAAGQSILATALRDANQGFAERTELERQYAPIADDLNSKMVLLGNAFRELAYSIGVELAPALKGSVDLLTGVVQGISDFVESPVGAKVTQMVAALATLVGAYAAVRSMIALATASMIAFNAVTSALKGTGIVASLSGLATSFRDVGAGATAGATGVRLFNAALKTLGRITVVGALLYAVSELLFNTRESLIWVGDTFIWLADTVVTAMSRINPLLGALGVTMTQNLRDLGGSIQDWGETFPKAADEIDTAGGSMSDFNDLLDELDQDQPDLSPTEDGIGDVGKAAQDAAKEVRTLKDYANDLSGVWSRAFEIRYSPQQTLDAIKTSIRSIRDGFRDALRDAKDAVNATRDSIKGLNDSIRDSRQTIRGLKADIKGLKSDIAIQEYFLSVAVEYGDTKRAAAIEANLAKLRADLANKTEDLSAAQKKLRQEEKERKKEQELQKKREQELQKLREGGNRTLRGNSRAAIENRAAILDLVGKYQAHAEALASSGLRGKELSKALKQLESDFRREAQALGFNRDELTKYTAAFSDMKKVVRNVSAKVTVRVSKNAAETAINEFKAQVDKANTSVGSLQNTLKKGFKIPRNITGPQITVPPPIPWKSWDAFMQSMRTKNNPLFKGSGMSKRERDLFTQGIKAGYMDGGFTGRGARTEPAGTVHRGEFVIPKQYVNQTTGLPYADALGRMMGGVPGPPRAVAATSAASSGATAVSLTAGTLQALGQIIGRQIVMDGKIVAGTTSQVYSYDNMVGAG